MACCASSFTGNTFHSTPIAEKTISIIIDYIITRFIEFRSRVSLGDSEPDSVREPLTQGTSRDLNPGRIMRFRVARSDAVHGLFGQESG